MAHLFSKIVLQDALKNVSIVDIENKIAILMEWNEMYQKWELQKKKETAFEATYSEKLFWTILGYNDVGGGLYTREKHPKNASNGQTCDIGLGYYSSEKNETQAVVELKDAGTSIDRPQQREGNMTPIQQGFKYKPLYNSRWVIVSNYQEIRLYRDTYQDYEVWTLAELVNPANDYEKFRIFYLLLRAESLISETGESETEKLLAKVRIEQEMITKKFYKEYSGLRADLMRDIWKNNPKLQNESVVTITQRIIDRIVFVHFCEDRGLLPQNKLAENLTRAKEIDLTPWEVLMLYFRWIDRGSDKLGIPDGYNGGLFRDDDDIIKNLKVSDDVITKFIELGRYDFSDEGGQLSVEILGHIFEQSISDLESIREKIKNPGGESDEKKVSKRKKDGIFYTPAYIVDYIVRNSLGKYLEEHEERIKEAYKLKWDITEKIYRKREIEAYTEYQKILHTVKVLDPACGSGAFLVRVFDFLLEENKRVANILTEWAQSDLFQSEMYFRGILKNNIYGVDLNEESVEITKLSLWLKSAVRGKKLETLDNNIKCGNSLIDDPKVAGDKAFIWNIEFADIMASGGFDVIVGNPPYVRQELIKHQSDYFSKTYKSFSWKTDLYVYFFEQGVNLLKNKGILAYISSWKFLEANYGVTLREYLFKNTTFLSLIDFWDLEVFPGVSAYPLNFSCKKSAIKSDYQYLKVNSLAFISLETEVDNHAITCSMQDFERSWFSILSNDTAKVMNIISTKSYKFSDLYPAPVVWIKTGYNEWYIGQGDLKYLLGKNIKKYSVIADNSIVFPYEWSNESYNLLNEDSPIITPLIPHKDQLSKRAIISDWIQTGQKKWYEYQQINRKINFEDEFIVYPNVSLWSNFCLSKSRAVDMTAFIIPSSSKFLLSILNSKLFSWFMNVSAIKRRWGYVEMKTQYIVKFPLKKVENDKQQPFIDKADLMLSLNRDLQEKSSSFIKNIQAKYSVSKITRKLEKWWELDFAEFLKETKISIPLAEQEELMQYFETRRAEARAIDIEIRKTDAEIDTMVFDLYGLTEEERKVVLGSIGV
jgi:type I restriction-modification system DNA methylase subunit